MPVEVIVCKVELTDEERSQYEQRARETSCPKCGVTVRGAARIEAEAVKLALWNLHRQCRCKLLPRFYEREIPLGVELWIMDAGCNPHRVQVIGGQLFTPWGVLTAPVCAVKVVATTYEDNASSRCRYHARRRRWPTDAKAG